MSRSNLIAREPASSSAGIQGHSLRLSPKRRNPSESAWFERCSPATTLRLRRDAPNAEPLDETLDAAIRDASGPLEALCALVALLEDRDPSAARHSVVVAHYSEVLARRLRLAPELIALIRAAATVHDVGKIGIPRAILTKPNRLTPCECARMQEHSRIGAEMLRGVGFRADAIPLVLFHHERFDGRGYPSGLAGQAIPLGARVIHVADTIDAILSPRGYKPAYTIDVVRRELLRGRAFQFDPVVADAAIGWLCEEPAELTRVQHDGLSALRLALRGACSDSEPR